MNNTYLLAFCKIQDKSCIDLIRDASFYLLNMDDSVFKETGGNPNTDILICIISDRCCELGSSKV